MPADLCRDNFEGSKMNTTVTGSLKELTAEDTSWLEDLFDPNFIENNADVDIDTEEEIYDLFEFGSNSSDDEFNLLDAEIDKDMDCTSDNSDSDFLFPGASVTVGAFMLLLAFFGSKYNISSDGIVQLLNIISLILPNGHNLCTSLYAYKRYFKNLRNPLIKHYYCNHCLCYIDNIQTDVCANQYCNKNISNEKSYFLELPLIYQIQSFFREEGFHKKIQGRFEHLKNQRLYRDIYDGSLYRSLFDNDGPLSVQDNLSFVLNTDGAQVFKSSKVSLWPIFMVINELPYTIRMKPENMLLAGLWFGNRKPAMNTFLKPLLNSMEQLLQGIECFSPERGSFICKCFLLATTADLPARSLLCNSVQFNGLYSCWKCLQPGKTAAVGKGHTHVYPYVSTCPKGPERTFEMVMADAREAVAHQLLGHQKAINGIKGPSWLAWFPLFNIVQGVGIDYMHGILLGVQKLLIKLWFAKDFSGRPFNFYRSVGEVDKRLRSILPTPNISRLPRSIEHDLKYWKASEYRSFLLFYGVTVLDGILDTERFQHYSDFVGAIQILLYYGSTEYQLQSAEIFLFRFCENFATLYNECYMTLNVHQLVHIVDSVRQLGPLYTHSCFPFEDKNGFVLKQIRGTQNIDNQIITGVSFVQKLPELKQTCIVKGLEVERIYNAIDCPNIIKRRDKIFENAYVLGALKEKELNDEEFALVCRYMGYCSPTNVFKCFNRLELNGFYIYGDQYARMKRRKNSAIMLETNCFGLVKFFLLINNEVFAFIQNIQSEALNGTQFIFSVTNRLSTSLIPVKNIKDSCMFIEVDSKNVRREYICVFPNKLEKD